MPEYAEKGIAQWVFEVPVLPSPVRLSVRPHSTAVTLAGMPIYIFDPGGRLYGAFVEGRNYLRGLDGRVMEKWGRRQTGVGVRRFLPEVNADALCEAAYAAVLRLRDALETGMAHVLDREPGGVPLEWACRALETVCRWDLERLHADGKVFLSIYKPVGILPPDQYMSLVLQATEGCSHNRCTFCSFYRGRPFRIKTLAEFNEHVIRVKEFMGPALRMRRKIFLADANSMVIPKRRLVPMLDLINSNFKIVPVGSGPARYRRIYPEAFDGVYAFVDAFSARYKTVDDFSALAARNVRRVYIGLETGHDPLLAWLRKVGTSHDAVEAVRNIKQGGISVGVIIMAGVGGRRFACPHVSDTVRTVNTMALGKDDFVYISALVVDRESEYRRIAEQEGVQALTDDEVKSQMRAIRSGLRFGGPAPRVSMYDIREFLY